jgi:signal peptidase I
VIDWRPVLADEVPASDLEAPGLPPFGLHEVASPLRALVELPLLLLLAALIAFGVKSVAAQAFYIPSGSMEPQLQINDRVVVSKLAYRLHSPRRGDIIVFDAPPHQEATHATISRGFAARWTRKLGEAVGLIQPSTSEFIKRVVGLPGEAVEGRGGQVYIDGRRLVEPYLGKATLPAPADFGPVTVPPASLWVMGDNRLNSCDSRCFPLRGDSAFIPVSTIVGRTLLRVWPLGHAAFL